MSETSTATLGTPIARAVGVIRRRAAGVLLIAAVTAPSVAFIDIADLGICDGLIAAVTDDGFELCTHGDDEHLAAAAAGEPARTAGPVPTASVQCYEDGSSGPRVQILYVHSGADRLPSLRADITRWTEQVEWTFRASAEATGGRRFVRWVTAAAKGDGCVLDVQGVRISSSELDDFAQTVSALRRAGWDDANRKYLVFADSDRYCGLAHLPRDERDAPDNAANTRSGYARVDRPCWDAADAGIGSVAAHELMHTLGGIQPGAPHATAGGHCTDEHDLMCYRDGEGVDVSVRCRDELADTSGAGDQWNWLFDCGGDDYFHPAAPRGSYLHQRWNSADSIMLADHTSSALTFRGRFKDDDRSPFEADIEWVAASGITQGCAAERFCPGTPVTRQQMAAFLVRGLDLQRTSGITFIDVPSGSPFATDIDRLATAGITQGCGNERFCPHDSATREQMAALLVRALDLRLVSGTRFSDVPVTSAFAADIDRLATAGITRGCGRDRFCPSGTVSRGEMAVFLRRALDR